MMGNLQRFEVAELQNDVTFRWGAWLQPLQYAAYTACISVILNRWIQSDESDCIESEIESIVGGTSANPSGWTCLEVYRVVV